MNEYRHNINGRFSVHRKNFLYVGKLKKNRNVAGFKMFLMISPFLAVSFIFSYLPLYGWLYSFYDFRPPLRLSQSEFVGLFWFESLISTPARIKQTLQVLSNTFGMSGLGILTSWLPMAFAILLAEIRSSRYKKIVQTLTTLPNFVSWVLVYSFAFAIFSSVGVFNHIMLATGLSTQPIMVLSSGKHVWLTMTAWGVWKGLGWGAILYLATISGIDQEMYEAARVDGAGRFRSIWHITIPSLLPTYFVLLLLSIANFLNNGFDQYYVFQNAFNANRIQVLDLYVYNIGMGTGNYSLATTVSMFKSVISITLLFIINNLSKRVRGVSII